MHMIVLLPPHHCFASNHLIVLLTEHLSLPLHTTNCWLPTSSGLSWSPVVFGLFSWFLNNPKVKWFQAFSVLMIIHDFTHLKRVLLVFLTGCGLWYGCWSTFNCATSSIMCAKRLTVWYAQSKSKLIAATIWLAIWLASWLHPYSLCLLSIQFLIACSMHTVDGGKI